MASTAVFSAVVYLLLRSDPALGPTLKQFEAQQIEPRIHALLQRDIHPKLAPYQQQLLKRYGPPAPIQGLPTTLATQLWNQGLVSTNTFQPAHWQGSPLIGFERFTPGLNFRLVPDLEPVSAQSGTKNIHLAALQKWVRDQGPELTGFHERFPPLLRELPQSGHCAPASVVYLPVPPQMQPGDQLTIHGALGHIQGIAPEDVESTLPVKTVCLIPPKSP